ncbi:MAG TPA: hypothetical protein PL027_07465 [Thermosynergistes sp.]|nr:hypothetical protein [Thermosynergistes sp.]
MSERVFYSTVDLTRLQALVDVCRPQARFAIVERIDAIDFPLPQTEQITVADWPKGRLFDEAFELRWEQIGQEYRIILSGNGNLSTLAAGLSEQPLPASTDEVQDYYCWNETDARLGRTLNYRCVPKKGNVKLSVAEFRDDHGRLVFWRYIKMERDGGEQ